MHERTHPSDSASSRLRAMVGFFLAFIVLVAVDSIALDMTIIATPGVMIGRIGGGILAAIAALTLAVCMENRHCERLTGPLGR